MRRSSAPISPNWVYGVLVAATVVFIVKRAFEPGETVGGRSARGTVLLALTAIAIFVGLYVWYTRKARRE